MTTSTPDLTDLLHPQAPVVDDKRRARLEAWIERYAASVREQWIEHGDDPDSPAGVYAMTLVKESMRVPERPEWMPLGKAMGMMFTVSMGAYDPTPEFMLDFRDALRTFESSLQYEREELIAQQLGISVSQIRTGDIGPDEDSADGVTALYRHFDDTGRLLYVGIAHDPDARAAQHRANSPWAILSSRVEIDWHDTRDEARDAERDAIQTEAPLFNIANASPKAKQLAIDYLLARVALAAS